MSKHDANKLHPDRCVGTKVAVHLNGGGFVSNSSEVDPTALIGEGVSICGGAKVGPGVEVLGDVVVNGKVEINGCVSIDGHDYDWIDVGYTAPRVISGFGDHGIKIANDCSKPDQRTKIFAEILRLEGEINISQPVELMELITVKGHKNGSPIGAKVDLIGQCDSPMLLITDFSSLNKGFIQGPSTISNCVRGVYFSKIENSSLLGPTFSKDPELIPELYVGLSIGSSQDVEIVDSTLMGHMRIDPGVKIIGSTVQAPSYVKEKSITGDFDWVDRSVFGGNIKNGTVNCFPTREVDTNVIRGGPCYLIGDIDGGTVSGSSVICKGDVLTGSLSNQSLCQGTTKRISWCDAFQPELVDCGEGL